MTDQDINHLNNFFKDKTPTKDQVNEELEQFRKFKDRKDKMQKMQKTISKLGELELEQAAALKKSREAYYEMLKQTKETI